MGGRPSATSAAPGHGTPVASATPRPSGTGTGMGTAHCRFGRSSGGGGTGGTQRSGNTGQSPRDLNARAIEASADSSLLDDDSSLEPSDNLIVAKLNGDCLGGCGKVHPPHECPNLVGDVEHQKKTFASLSGRRRYLPARGLTPADDYDNDVDLIDLHDPEDQDSDLDQDFP